MNEFLILMVALSFTFSLIFLYIYLDHKCRIMATKETFRISDRVVDWLDRRNRMDQDILITMCDITKHLEQLQEKDNKQDNEN